MQLTHASKVLSIISHTVSRSPSCLTKMMLRIVEVDTAPGLIVSEELTEMSHMPEPHTAAQTLRSTAAGQKYAQNIRFVYLWRYIKSLVYSQLLCLEESSPASAPVVSSHTVYF